MAPAHSQLTRDDVVRGATRLVDAEGLDGLSMRRLAVDLGVTPMALYRHVTNKDELLTEVVDVLLRDAGLPRAGPADWQGWLAAAARQLRSLLVAHPGALGVFCREPVSTPAFLERMDEGLGRLRAAGFSHDRAVQAFAAVHTYTIGFCSLAATRSNGRPAPRAAAADVDVAAFTSEAQFSFGLDAILAGLSSGITSGVTSGAASPDRG